jgi:hypothetical protein
METQEGIVDLCPFRNAFGIAGKGIHSYRIYDVAVLDFGVTFLAAAVIAFVFQWPLLWTFIGLFILGIFAHRMFYARTTVDKWLFSQPRDKYCPINTA